MTTCCAEGFSDENFGNCDHIRASFHCSGGPCEQSTQEILDMVNRCNEEIDKLRPNAAACRSECRCTSAQRPIPCPFWAFDTDDHSTAPMACVLMCCFSSAADGIAQRTLAQLLCVCPRMQYNSDLFQTWIKDATRLTPVNDRGVLLHRTGCNLRLGSLQNCWCAAESWDLQASE
jgi:hypothetical protein